MIARIFCISIYLFSITECVPKTSQETGNDIEKFLLESGPTSSPPTTTIRPQKKPDKFMEDLIEVQRTYRNLKQKWQRMMEEKSDVMRRASETTTTTTTTTSPPDIQQIDVDVFEAPDNFQDISEPTSSAFDGFEDISEKTSELDEIQMAIREAFGGKTIVSTTLRPNASMATREEENQRDGNPTHVKVDRDQTTPAEQAPESLGDLQKPLDPSETPEEAVEEPKSLGGPRTQSATEWRRKIPKPEEFGPTSTKASEILEDLQKPLDPKTLLSTFGGPEAPRASALEAFGQGSEVPGQAATSTKASEILEDLQKPLDPSETPKEAVEAPRTLLSTFGGPGAPRASAFEGRRKLPESGAFGQGSEVPGQAATSTEAPEILVDAPKTLLSTFGGPEAPRATENEEDPFETTVPPTTTTSLPLHILPKSTFHSSGSHPDALPATNLFRYPDQVQIPFFGATTSSEAQTTPQPSEEEEEEEEEEVEVDDSEYYDSEDVEEITKDLTTTTTTIVPIEKNEDYVEETFSQEVGPSEGSFAIGKAPKIPEALEAVASLLEVSDGVGSPPGSSGSFGSRKGPSDAPGSFGIFGSPPGSPQGSSGSFGSGRGPSESPRSSEAFGSPPGSSGTFGSRTGPSNSPGSSEVFGNPPGSPLGSSGSFGSRAGHSEPPRSSEVFGSPPGSSEPSGSMGIAPGSSGTFGSRRGPSEPSGSFGTFGRGPSDPPRSSEAFGSPPGSSAPSGSSEPLRTLPASFGIGRAPPGSSGSTTSSTEAPKQFPTLINEEVEKFFADSSESRILGNIPVEQHLEILDDPIKPKPKPKKARKARPEPVGIFGTKIAAINERAYRPPMFPSAMSSQTIRMPSPRNPYLERTTIPPIGPHGLAETPSGNEVFSSVDMELPALGMRDNGIMNRARREYQKEFEQQIRDVRMIDEEMSRISQMNDNGRSKTGQRCSQIYAHTLSLPQIQKMSASLGLSDVAVVIRQASDLTQSHTEERDISQLENELEEKRRLIAKIEILLSLAESRALLYDLLKEQKKIAEKMENSALDMLQKTNFRPSPPNLFSAASDISELSSAVQQVLGGSDTNSQKRGWSMMRKKTVKNGRKEKKNFEIVPENALVVSKKSGHLQETAEIVEPVLVPQNERFGRQPTAPIVVHKRPLPVAPPTMNPMDFRFGRPTQRAAHQLPAAHPISPHHFQPPTDEQITESETVHELIDMLHEDIVKLPEEELEQVCRQVQCDFEKADLCNFESSHDETTRMRKTQKREKREADLLAEPSTIADDLLPYAFRAWSIWAGRRADRQKQIDIGPDFSPRNTHFAAVFLEPQQAGILSVPLILSGTATTIRLRLFEATRGMRLRVCCDRYCPLETEPGLYRGHRVWLRKTITCPANTQTLSFECLNNGSDRGACGVDEIFVDSSRCHHFFNGKDQS